VIAAAPIHHFVSIDSTNLEARRLVAAGEKGPLWLLADEQTGGKGRLGRQWHSPVGNLYTTLLLPLTAPAHCIAQIGFAVALAVHDVAVAFAPGKSVHLKWPNDCLLGGGKLAGILCETVSARSLVVAIGCGINVASQPEDVPYPAARLAGAAVPQVFSVFRGAMAHRLEQWDSGRGFASVAADWQARAIGLGDDVTITTANQSHTGVFTGLADDGAMLIELASGPQRFYAGDVIIPSLQHLRSSAT
jgi:BirA family transcriptional regulator, biotin operon repressor / biotin---[acetyl-CoA-carboxylase] ligase